MRTRPIFAALLAATTLILSAQLGHAQSPPAGAPPAAGADAAEEAKTRYERGTQLYADGDYKLALIEFERAYELAPNYKALYNIAQTNSQLGKYGAARRAFERYLKDGGKEIPDKRRAEVEKELVSLRGRTASVSIVTDVEGAEIVVDGQVVAKTPVTGALMVDAGQHTIEARKPGRITSSRPVTLAGTDEVKIEFELPPEPPPVTPTVLAPIRETTIIQGSSSYTWVGWVIAGTLLAGATATGVVTLSFSSDLGTARDQPLQPGQTEAAKRQELDDKQKRARATAITTDVLGGAAILTAGVTLIFTIIEATSGKNKKDEKHAAIPFQIMGGPGNVTLLGQF